MRYVHPEALAEYAEAVRYYAQQRVELAQAFIDAIEEAAYRIGDSPLVLSPLVMRYDGAWHAGFRMVFSTRSSKTTVSFWQ